MQEIKKLKLLPIWDVPSSCLPAFNTGMQANAPFIVTQFQQRSDLGQCIISTLPPHYVAKIRAFKTNAHTRPNVAPNEKQVAMADREEMARQEYIDQRTEAWNNEQQADKGGLTVREYIEAQGRVYDEEFDEPRLVAKVPGLNVYLELIGCLDEVDADSLDWDTEAKGGPYHVLNSMCLWAQNIWDRQDRRPRATQMEDPQPLPDWHEEYDPETRPWMPRKRGLGLTYIDPSRRPDLLHTHTPGADKNIHEMSRLLKKSAADLAAQGIAPEEYGQ